MDAGVINEYINPSKIFKDIRDSLFHTMVGRNVELFKDEPLVVFQVRHGRQRPTGRNHQAVLGGEGPCQGVAYPAGGAARYQNHLFVRHPAREREIEAPRAMYAFDKN